MNIEAGEGYRLLQIGETILEGDEFSTAARHPTGWSRVVSNFGYVVQPFHMPIRRKLPAAAPTDWIKCSERLPEKGECAWVSYGSREVHLFMACAPDMWSRMDITHWQPATVPVPPEPEKSEAEKAADRYVESLLAPPDRSNAKRDFMAGWEARRP